MALQFLIGSLSKGQSDAEGTTRAHAAIRTQSPPLGRALTKIRQKGPAVPPPAWPFMRKCSQGGACWGEQGLGAEGPRAFFFYSSWHNPTSILPVSKLWSHCPFAAFSAQTRPTSSPSGATHNPSGQGATQPSPSLLLQSQAPASTPRLTALGGFHSRVLSTTPVWSCCHMQRASGSPARLAQPLHLHFIKSGVCQP